MCGWSLSQHCVRQRAVGSMHLPEKHRGKTLREVRYCSCSLSCSYRDTSCSSGVCWCIIFARKQELFLQCLRLLHEHSPEPGSDADRRPGAYYPGVFFISTELEDLEASWQQRESGFRGFGYAQLGVGVRDQNPLKTVFCDLWSGQAPVFSCSVCSALVFCSGGMTIGSH